MSDNIFRKTPPESADVDKIKIIEGGHIMLSNGLKVYYVNAGTSDVIKLDIVFDAGIREQQQKGVAVACSSMLTDGTKTKTAEQIADELDYYGAYLQTRCTVDDSCVTLYCLPKHLSSCLPYVLDVIQDSVFPENELTIYKTNAIQRLLVNKERTAFLSRRIFYSSVFGEDSPYGIFSETDDYNNISRETLQSFFANHINGNIKYLHLSGSVNQDVLTQIETSFGVTKYKSGVHSSLKESRKVPQKIFFRKKGASQSTIRIGRQLFNRKHPDFQKMQFLNLILGGYFGSRLMKNIREDKGLTYGIHSSVESFRDSGCFYIETEINNSLTQKGITEIYKELNVLRTSLISHSELSLAKNYMLGSFLRSIDGPFSLADRQKILIDFGLDYDYYYRFIKVVKSIEAPELRDLANVYLSDQDLFEIIVGDKE